jgi:hypothetical protein
MKERYLWIQLVLALLILAGTLYWLSFSPFDINKDRKVDARDLLELRQELLK